MPRTCRVHFDDPNTLHLFQLTIQPDEGYWLGGKYRFQITVPEEYNIAVSLCDSLKLDNLGSYFGF